ncbi:transcription initiation factor TFIID subunit 2 [Asparagus officinalis]|uniref:transcription initiation factor TFIID subunit 2 n=1 Tax=Asparagus officinalis TaxID=4686 RepID=UPI00098E2F02|nr:transcription initiation factor TFIID subunit 2 [Asparagus officinalis]
MAKPRKSKNEEQKNESSGCVALHQKLCLSIDMDRKRIFGYTELKILASEVGYVALHADDMVISSVTVDGEPVEFEHIPHYQHVEDERRWSSVSCCQTAADAACSTYLSLLNREMVPNLLISCNKSKKTVSNQSQGEKENIVQNSSAEEVVNGYSAPSEDKDVKHVRINYWVERAEAGIHFGKSVMHTNNQIRRARCWFPCIDSISQCCTFDMEFTVNSGYVAVSNGDLLYQVLSKDDPPRKTYVYKLNIPVSAGWISLAVGSFEILPDSHTGTISYMCLPPNLRELQNTVSFFHQAFSHYEDYLSMSFPFGSYKQIFIPPEISLSSTSLGASMCIFTSQLLFDEKVIDKTIETRVKLAYALARQWFGVYITVEERTDEWLLDGLAGFLTDSFIKKFFGNNEARFRRYKSNCTVCKVDINGATALSSFASSDLYGTQTIGLHGKIRSWKAVAVLQMLEKQMGPDSFRKILQSIVYRGLDAARSRTLSTKEFSNLAYKVGNLERPFLKEFFPSWVESCGCPILRMGLSYIKRKNMIEFAVMRGCTAKPGDAANGNIDTAVREGDTGWPGMMSIRVHELDGTYDHPSLPLAGDAWQLLEIQCHSKLTLKRIQKPKKGSKPDGSDDNADLPNLDARSSMDSPLLWIRVDPDMEYLAEIHFHQPIQMWINQLEKDKDVVAQAQAIAMLEKLPQLSFAVVNALNNFLSDSKAFWRVRIEAAYALAHTASEDTDWAGLLHLIKFYKSRRFDADIGLPKPNDFYDVPEYFVLEAIPHAIALVKAADKKSPREAVEFILQLLKYNDNNGNPYSDVFWLCALVQSVGELEFGQQNISFLSSLLKRIDQLLQFDSFMPRYNGILTVSCLRTLAQIGWKMSSIVPLERISEVIKPFCSSEKASWIVRLEACKLLLDLEFHCRGLDATLSLFMKFLEEETSLRGETKLAVHVMHLCQINAEAEIGYDVTCPTLVALLCMLASKKAFNNVFLRHYLFGIIQIVAGRPPTLYGVPKTLEQFPTIQELSVSNNSERKRNVLKISKPQETSAPATSNLSDAHIVPIVDASKDADTVSNNSERKRNVLKIKVKQPGSSSKADGIDQIIENSRGGQNDTNEVVGPTSSVSVDAPNHHDTSEPLHVSNQNIEEVNSCYVYESRVTASIGSSAKLNKDGVQELQCTADSRKSIPWDQSSPVTERTEVEVHQEHSLLQEATVKRKTEKKKDKEKKRKREDKSGEKDRSNDPAYLERKRQKKEKKRLKKMEKMMKKGEGKSLDDSMKPVAESSKGDQSSEGSKKLQGKVEDHNILKPKETSSAPKLKIKIRSLGGKNG